MLPRLAVVPIVAATIVLGVRVAGGVITNDFRASMALTGIWFALTALVCCSSRGEGGHCESR